jgi:hypothetical protein
MKTKMERRAWRWPIVAALLVSSTLVGPTGRAQQPPLGGDELGRNPYGRMHMLLEKTFLNIDVLAVEIRFGPDTADALRALAVNRAPSAALTERIAARAYRAEDAYVEIRFKRDVGVEKFIAAVRKSLERARRAEMIDEDSYQSISRNLPHWFAFLNEQGIKSGDRLIYRARPTSLRTVFVDRKGLVRLDQTDSGTAPRLALLAGYFAPGSDFRNGLVASLNRE